MRQSSLNNSMDSVGQLQIFLKCIAVGYLCGVLYEPFAVLRRATGCVKSGKLFFWMALDVLFFTVFAAVYIGIGTALSFPCFRPFMAIGAFVGLILYLKSLHRILDFFENVCYNTIRGVVKKLSVRLKKKKKSPKKRGESKV